jgi:hypothetical protein
MGRKESYVHSLLSGELVLIATVLKLPNWPKKWKT